MIATESPLVEMNIHEMLINLGNMGLDIISEATEAILSGKLSHLEKTYPKLRDKKERLEKTRIMFMEYLVRVASELPEKDLYASLVMKIDRIMQIMDGAAYRLKVYLAKYSIDEEVSRQMGKMLRSLLNEYGELQRALEKLRYNPAETIRIAENIKKYEEYIDELYRELELMLFHKYSDNILALMLLKEAVDLIEDAADLTKEAGEEARYIALHRTI